MPVEGKGIVVEINILGELTKVLVGDRSEYVEITFWLLEKKLLISRRNIKIFVVDKEGVRNSWNFITIISFLVKMLGNWNRLYSN